MAQQCDLCSQPVYRKIWTTDAATGKMVGKGVECGCTRKPKPPVGTDNVFSVTLQHVHDEFGKPIRVDNLRQLSAAESRYGFESCILSRNEQNFNDAPQQRKFGVADLYRRKFGGPRR